MKIGLGLGIGVNKTGGGSWIPRLLTDGLIVYRRRCSGGVLYIDYSDDGGATWELNIASFLTSEDVIQVTIDNSPVGYRDTIRDGAYVIDQLIDGGSGLFTGTEGVDWENIYKTSIWTPESELGGELPSLWVKENSRSGLTLTDSVDVGNSPTILPSYLNKPSGDEIATVFDNGSLDIGSQDLTLCGWFNATSAYKTSYQFLCGKQASSTNGQYGFYVEPTTGYYGVNVRSSGGYVVYPSAVDYSTAGWCFLVLKIVVATKKITFKINDVQIGVDQDYTGTFSALVNEWGFNLGAQQASTAPTYNNYARAMYSDIRVYHSALSDGDLTTLYNRGYVAGAAAHWPCNSWNINDVVGGFHMTGTNLSSTKRGFSSYGSRQSIDKGYSAYRHLGFDQYPEIQVSFTDAGTAIVNPIVPTGYTKFADFAADALNHNLADCKIQFVGAEWLRSDTTIFGAMARLGFYDVTDATTQKQFHISELNKNILNSFYNPLYRGVSWVKCNNNTVTDRQKMLGLFTYATNKTGSDYIQANRYCNDRGVSQYIDTYIEDKNIVTQRGLKALQFNTTTKVLSLSIDDGVTFPYSVDLTGVCTKILRARIYVNGNIGFADDTKFYYSDDNLSTYQESTIVAAGGGAYTATTYDNFTTLVESGPVIIGGVEIDIWSCYTNQAPTKTDNINIWYSIDSGVTVKSAYKYGVSLPALTVLHSHFMNYNSEDGYFYSGTGDGANTVNLIRGSYSWGTDAWTWTSLKVSDGATFWKTTGMGFYDGYMFWGNDSAANFGVWKNTYADAADNTKMYRVSSSLTQLTGSYDDLNGIMLVSGMDSPVAGEPIIHISTDRGATWVKYCITGIPALAVSFFLTPIIGKNNAGYFLIELVENGEDVIVWRGGKKLMLKIVK